MSSGKNPLRRWMGHQAARAGFWRLELMYGERNVSRPGPEIRAGIDVEVRVATADDFAAVEAAQPTPQDLRLFRIARECGGLCFVAWADGRPAGYSWLILDSVKLGKWVLRKLPADYGYQCDSVVFPEFRGKKLFQKLSSEMDAYLRAQGRQRACNLVTPDNAASIEARRKLGATFRPVTILKFPFFPPFVARGRLFD